MARITLSGALLFPGKPLVARWNRIFWAWAALWSTERACRPFFVSGVSILTLLEGDKTCIVLIRFKTPFGFVGGPCEIGGPVGCAIGGAFTGAPFAAFAVDLPCGEVFPPGGDLATDPFAPGSGAKAFPAKAFTASAPTKAFATTGCDLTIVANTTQVQGMSQNAS